MFDECLYDVGDEPGEYIVLNRTAQSVVECCECGEEILEDQQYEFVAGNYDGDWSVYCTCGTCQRIRDSLFKGEFIHGNLWKRLGERYGPTPKGIDPNWTANRAAGVEVADQYVAELEERGLV